MAMIRLIKPYIQFDEVQEEFRSILDSGILTRGPYSQAFPAKMEEYTGAKHSFNATSATTALSACLEILGIGGGDEVIVSDFSFPASSNVVEACGARPVFADVSLQTYNMLPAELEQKITPKTKAVIFVSALGNPSGILRIREICRAKGIPLIHDAACAIGSSVDGVKVGNLTDLECFSFHPRKLLTSGEGGAITTSNAEFARQLTIKLAHGATVTDGKMDFVTYGYNYRLPELQCVMLIKQLEKLDAIVQRRIAIQKEYTRRLSSLGYVPQACDENVVHNVQSLAFTVPGTVSRDGLIAHLKANGVEATIGTYCLSHGSYNLKKYQDVQKNAWELEQCTVTLPCYDDVDIDAVMAAVEAYSA